MGRISFFAIGLFFAMLFTTLSFSFVLASENDDLRFLPQTEEFTRAVKKAPSRSKNQYNFFIEQTASKMENSAEIPVDLPRDRLIEYYYTSSLDMFMDLRLLNSLRFGLSDRIDYFSVTATENDYDEIQNTFREGYFSWNPYQSLFLEVGRINIKMGSAIGFNPTDYFKKNAANIEDSQDLQVLRDRRMGTLMFKANFVSDYISVLLALAPKISTVPNELASDKPGSGLFLNRTNASRQFLSKVTLQFADDFAPEFLYFQREESESYGFNLSKGLGQSLVFYIEWSGSRRPSIANEATAHYIAEAAPVVPTLAIDYSDQNQLYHQAAAGFSYSWSSADTTYFEYHLNQAGFGREDWKEWFATGEIASNLPEPARTSTLSQLWSIRDYARNTQEPMNMSSLFIRNSLSLLNQDLTSVQMVDYNLLDESFFFQIQFDYSFAPAFIGSFIAFWNFGKLDSEYGSLPRQQEVQLGLRYYL